MNKYIIQQDLCLVENPVPSKRTYYFSSVSNFRPVKNVLNVIKIFNNIQKKLNVRLLMIGEGA